MKKIIIGFFIFALPKFSIAQVEVVDSILFVPTGNGLGPTAVAVNSQTNKIYVANRNSDNVSVIDGENNTVIATVPVGNGPRGICVNSQTNKIYVANSYSNNVSVINGTNNTVIATVPVGDSPDGICVDSQTNKIYVVNSPYSGDNVSVIDGENNTVIDTVPVGEYPAYPEGICVNSQTNKIYVVKRGSNSILVIDGEDNTVTQAVRVGKGPVFIAVNQQTNLIYVSCRFAGGVWVLKDNTGVEESQRLEVKSLKPELEIYPNPFTQKTEIRFQIPNLTSDISLKIYDVTGRRVKTLVNGEKKFGNYNVNFDAKGLSAGIYFVKLVVGDYKESKKITLMR